MRRRLLVVFGANRPSPASSLSLIAHHTDDRSLTIKHSSKKNQVHLFSLASLHWHRREAQFFLKLFSPSSSRDEDALSHHESSRQSGFYWRHCGRRFGARTHGRPSGDRGRTRSNHRPRRRPCKSSKRPATAARPRRLDVADESSTLPAVAASKVCHENLQRELDGTYWNHLMVEIKARAPSRRGRSTRASRWSVRRSSRR